LLVLQTRIEHDGSLGSFLGRVKGKAIRRFFGPERILDLGLRFGPYGALSRLKFSSASSAIKGLSLRKLQQAAHGIDLGPLTPCLPARLRTSDKCIELAPEVLVKDVERVKVKFFDNPANDSNGHLLLIGRRQLRSNNSWMHNSERLVKGNPAKPACSVLMNPADAAHRNLQTGERVVVRSDAGSIVVPVEVSEEMMPGVVSIPHGWGHSRPGNRLAVAQQYAGESINDLTHAGSIDALCGTAAFSGTPVVIQATEPSAVAPDNTKGNHANKKS
jgi:anaerobic selenocysteine-containing dehydrogenase